LKNLQIRTYPDPILRKETEPVEIFDSELMDLIEEMKVIMLESDGVGLAAPQVGLSKKLAVVFYDDTLYVLINPVLLSSEGEQVGEEGCLSFPGIFGNVKRSRNVVIEAYNEHGEKRKIEAEGFLARAFLHEMDHLEGKLLIDHFSPLKKNIIRKKMRQYEKEERKR
jgi:peptide deformylase